MKYGTLPSGFNCMENILVKLYDFYSVSELFVLYLQVLGLLVLPRMKVDKPEVVVQTEHIQGDGHHAYKW